MFSMRQRTRISRLCAGKANPLLIYEDTRREVVQQCIANLMSTFYDYLHCEASSFTLQFQDIVDNILLIKSRGGVAQTSLTP